jgi:hypothetical protein
LEFIMAMIGLTKDYEPTLEDLALQESLAQRRRNYPKEAPAQSQDMVMRAFAYPQAGAQPIPQSPNAQAAVLTGAFNNTASPLPSAMTTGPGIYNEALRQTGSAPQAQRIANVAAGYVPASFAAEQNATEHQAQLDRDAVAGRSILGFGNMTGVLPRGTMTGQQSANLAGNLLAESPERRYNRIQGSALVHDVPYQAPSADYVPQETIDRANTNMLAAGFGAGQDQVTTPTLNLDTAAPRMTPEQVLAFRREKQKPAVSTSTLRASFQPTATGRKPTAREVFDRQQQWRNEAAKQRAKDEEFGRWATERLRLEVRLEDAEDSVASWESNQTAPGAVGNLAQARAVAQKARERLDAHDKNKPGAAAPAPVVRGQSGVGGAPAGSAQSVANAGAAGAAMRSVSGLEGNASNPTAWPGLQSVEPAKPADIVAASKGKPLQVQALAVLLDAVDQGASLEQLHGTPFYDQLTPEDKRTFIQHLVDTGKARRVK